MRSEYVLGPDGKRIPAYPPDGELVTCEACRRKVDRPRGEPEPLWYIRVDVVSGDVGSLSLQGDVCEDCRRERTFAEVVIAVATKSGDEFLRSVRRVMGES